MKNLSQAFKQSESLTLPEGLSERVFASIEQAMQARARFLRYAWSSFALASTGALVASGIYAVRRFAESGFASYFSLIFSDLGSVSLWWKELGLSLAESLPVVGIGIFLACLCAVLFSARRLSRHSPRLIIPSTASLA